MDDMEIVPVQNNVNQETVKTNRVKIYKTILNYFRGKSISLEVVIASKQPDVAVRPCAKNYEEFIKNIRGLHNDITLLCSLQDCVRLIQNSLTHYEIVNGDNYNLMKAVVNKIEGIAYFSKLIMQTLNNCYSELDLIEKKKNYSANLTEYSKKLEELRHKEIAGNIDKEEIEKTDKAELYLYKINLIRAMKAVLIGYITVNYPALITQIDQFRTPMRRNLTLDDFRETWDVGLTSC